MLNANSFFLPTQIKIIDAFDFPEQFSPTILKNIRSGKWIAFITTHDDIFDEQQLSQFYIVEKAFFLNNPLQLKSYSWEKQETPISMEKGVLGIYALDFIEGSEYFDELSDYLDNEELAIFTEDKAFFKLPFEDGYLSFDVARHDDEIVAIHFY